MVVRQSSLRWSVGIFLAIIGSMMLVVPHQFNSPVYDAARPFLALFGLAFVVTGMALLAIAPFNLNKQARLVIHIAGCVELLLLASALLPVRGWTGAANFSLLGLAVGVAPFLPAGGEAQEDGRQPDLLMISLGIAGAVTGLLILGLPGQFSSPIYDVIRSVLWAIGLAFLVGGLSLVYVQLRPRLPRPLYYLGHILAGLAFLWFFLASSVPLQAWIGIIYYGGFGLVIILSIVFEGRVKIDSRSLATRLALTLGGGITLSLVLVVAVIEAAAEGTIFGAIPEPQTGRDVAFAVLMIAAAIAVVVGVVLARRLAQPLNVVAKAASRFAAGDVSAPVPTSSVTEIDNLSMTFAEMRDSLEEQKVERENLLEQISGQHDLLAAVVNSSPAAICLWSGEDLRVKWYNPAYRSTLDDRYEDADLAGLQIQDYLPGAEKSGLAEIARQVVQTGLPIKFNEFEFGGFERGTTYWNFSLIPIQTETGQKPDVMLSAVDVTEQVIARRREEEARERAEEAVRLRDEFLSVASHELKTPITSMLGFSQLALKRLESEGCLDAEKGRRPLQIIEQQSHRLAALVTRLLDVSRIEAGRLVIERKETDLAGLVKQVAAAVQMNSRDHKIHLDVPNTLTACVDELRIEQVVTNLLDNAVRYSPDSTDIEVTLCCVDAAYRLEVRDYGPGIGLEYRETIFDRFFRGQARDGTGLGLGLYISNEIVKLHGGKIEVEEPENGGTRFVVTIPDGE